MGKKNFKRGKGDIKHKAKKDRDNQRYWEVKEKEEIIDSLGK